MNLRKDHYRCLLLGCPWWSWWQISLCDVTRVSPAGPGRRRATLVRVWRSPARTRGDGGLSARPGVVDSAWPGARTSTARDQPTFVRVPGPVASRWPGRACCARSNERRGSHSPGAALALCVFLLLSLTLTGKALVALPWSPVGVVAPAECPNLWLRPRDNSKRWITRLVCR